MRLVSDMQFCWSAVQMVGRLFGMVTTVSGGVIATLDGIGAFAGMVALAFATTGLASALALVATAALAALCFSSLSSFLEHTQLLFQEGNFRIIATGLGYGR
jgi:hypothetical protein